MRDAKEIFNANSREQAKMLASDRFNEARRSSEGGKAIGRGAGAGLRDVEFGI